MSSRSPKLYIEDILQASQEILDFTRDIHTVDEFGKDRRTFLAVVRSFEVIGEAARQMPRGFKSEHPEIPWREVASLRNVIAHEYFGLDNEIIWDVIQTQIPDLIEKFQALKIE
ncbi:MAG: DUF86 domain-containing protein [Anaerolineae bacterium]|nr:DUF86 domain-containing protein [Anaerolineae bacterium]MCI0610381.1 DUF86 domain-containing protein [Anaerolineae bacterium]